MTIPIFLKTGITAVGFALAGFATAAWFLPRAAPAPDSPATVARRAHSPLGKPVGAPDPATVQGHIDALRRAGTPGQQAAAALRLASLTDPDEIRALLDQAHRFPAHSASTLATQTLLKRWLELDPDAALEYSRLHFDKSLPKLIGTWSLTDPAQAEAWILALPGGKTKADAWQELCATTATRDPGKAWDLLARFPAHGGSDGSYEVRGLVDKLTAMDLEGTLARLPAMPAMLLKNARIAITKQLMESDPARGWDWARQQPNPSSLISQAIGVTLGKNPVQAFAWLETIPRAQRNRMMDEHGYNWGGRDHAALAAALSGNAAFTAQDKHDLASRLLNSASWQDPVGAEAFLHLLNEAELPGRIGDYLKNRAQKTTKVATEAWIAELPPGPLRTAAETAWQQQQQTVTVPVDRSTPASLVSQIKSGFYIDETDARISKINAAQLGDMMADQKSGGKSRFTTNILTSLAKTNPAPVAAWLASVPMDSTTGRQAAQFSANWAQEDPVAAATWVGSLPAGDLATTAAANVARQYHRYAPLEAKTWLETLPIGPVQEAAAKAMESNP